MHASHVHSRIATGEFVVHVYVLVVRVNVPREGWQFDSPHSPVLPCSCNVIGTLATLDVFSSEHPGQLPPQTLPERVTSTRSAGTRFSVSTTAFSSSASGHGSRGRSTWRPRVTAATRVPPYVPTYLCTYVRAYVLNCHGRCSIGASIAVHTA